MENYGATRCTKQNWFWFATIQSKTILTEPWMEWLKAGFKRIELNSQVISGHWNVQLGVVSILLERNPKIWSNKTDFFSSVDFDHCCHYSVLFCSLAVLDLRVGHTMDVLSPFISILCHSDSSTESPVHDLMLSIQAVRGLSRLHTPGIIPCIISFSRQFPCFFMVWPQYASFFALSV